MDFGISNYYGFYSIIGIILLIIFYFIRSKPKELSVPSLMFFLKQKKNAKRNLILRRIRLDWIFLLQFFILLLIFLALLEPWVDIQRDLVSDNIIFILDISASSQVRDINGVSRFDAMRNKAKDIAGDRNSVILIKREPIIALTDASRSEFKNFLDNLEVSDSSSNIGDAILIANELLYGKKGRVIVFSDFKNTGGIDPFVAKSVLLGQNIPVKFIDLGRENELRRNVGFVNAIFDENNVQVFIRNYNKNTENVKLYLNKNEGRIFTINGGDLEIINLELTGGFNEIKIEAVNNDFYADDSLYLVKPIEEKINVLLITDKLSGFLKAALTSSGDVNVVIKEPPVIPEDGYDIYIFDNIENNSLLPGTYSNFKEKLQNGAVIINSYKGIEYSEAKDLLGYSVNNRISDNNKVVIEQYNDLLEGIDFGSVNWYYNISDYKGINLASANGIPILILNEMGDGYVVYNGITDENSGFFLSTSYPIFWTKIIKELSNYKEMKDVNLFTGSKYFVSNSVGYIELNNIGFIKDYGISANLLSDLESDLGYVKIVSDSVNEYSLEPVLDYVHYDLTYFLLVLILILLNIEFLHLKLRGDL
ncbi:BatA domain-containing protein [Candidatus Woesearchaeota archaeon]|nr:BatA domain-containing protein [Candidatus Woesearchaeota archaeon]